MVEMRSQSSSIIHASKGELIFSGSEKVEFGTVCCSGVLACIPECSAAATLPDAIDAAEFRAWLKASGEARKTENTYKPKMFSLFTIAKVRYIWPYMCFHPRRAFQCVPVASSWLDFLVPMNRLHENRCVCIE